MKKLTLIVALGVVAYAGWDRPDSANSPASVTLDSSGAQYAAVSEWRSGDQVQGSGQVIRILSDDNRGSRHQRFVLKLSNGQTLLIAHNIDLARRIPSLRNGDTVSFYGEYEWNDQGGVIHWTHRDPQDRHAAGWLKHNGQTYQ